jgi:5-methylthioadenosine/S-adenosylhomocysteine deaminase
MNDVDSIIVPRWVVPVVPRGQVLEHHAVVVDKGDIVDILPADTVTQRYTATTAYHRPDHILMPGLINAHTHAAMALFRGLADDLPLMEWLTGHIWPAETRWVSPEFVRDGTRLAIGEMLLSGTTCFNDMYFFPDTTAEVAEEMGMRAVVGLIVIDAPTAWADNPADYMHKGLAVYDRYKDSSLITTALAPHAPYTVSDAPLSDVRMYADELDIPIHIHLHETAIEVENAKQTTGVRPLARLDQLGLVNARLVAVHMTQLLEEEISRLAEVGAHVVHCPTSNLKLASGLCPAQQLLDHGVNVALGTDSAASNNTLDMFAEIRHAALLGKITTMNPNSVDAITALEMATINGAKALGLEARVGSLEIGKAADMIALDMNQVSLSPMYQPLSHLVYATERAQVSDVWVGGRAVVEHYQLQNADVARMRTMAQEWGQRIQHT